MGNTNAFMGISGGGGTVIVNGTLQSVTPNYYGMGMTVAGYGCMGMDLSMMGYFTSQSTATIRYTIPSDPGYWPAFFFLGANPTYSGNTLLTLQNVNVPSIRQGELIELITRVKPMWTWCIAMINWT